MKIIILAAILVLSSCGGVPGDWVGVNESYRSIMGRTPTSDWQMENRLNAIEYRQRETARQNGYRR